MCERVFYSLSASLSIVRISVSVAWPQAGAGPRKAALTIIRSCQCAGMGSADKFQIVSIADERSAEDARGCHARLVSPQQVPSYSQQQATSSRKAGKALPPSAAPQPLLSPQPLTPLPTFTPAPPSPPTPSCLPWLSSFAC